MPALMEKHGLKNPHQVPRLNEDRRQHRRLRGPARTSRRSTTPSEELALITGQPPQVRRAKKSISNFKLREGMPIGVRVTLRGDRMWEFLDRLIHVAMPAHPRLPGPRAQGLRRLAATSTSALRSS